MVLAMVLQWDSKIAGLNNGPRWLVIMILPILYGGLIEVLKERFFYPRTGDWMDWVADVLGVVLGIGLWWIGEKIYERRMGK
jgi:VanZ family protein